MEHQGAIIAALLQQPDIEGEVQFPFPGGNKGNVPAQGKILGMGQNDILSQCVERFLHN